MKRNALSIISLALIALLCVAIYANPAHADSLQFCSPSVASSQSVPGPSGYTTTVSSASALKSGACASVPTPPSNTACVSGSATDLPNVKLVCSGTFVRPGCDPTVAGSCPTAGGAFSFANVFGAWPGTHFGRDEIFSLGLNQAISIPFTPSPGHSISIFINTTLTSALQNVFSISTEPGLFNNGKANGTTVVCAGGHNPNLTISSNGRAGVGCVLDPNKQYWFNATAGVVVNGTFTACTKQPCKVSVQEQIQN